jgi:glyoxylase-like metal-dependent hydrolase (beta-lactamase superfamily II)
MLKPLLALALLCLPSLAQGADASTITVKMRAVKVGAHAYYVQGLPGAASAANQGFMSNAGFVVTPDGVVVFDSLGTPPLAEALLAQIGKVTRAPIKRVIVSHYHADHIYGLQVFKAAGAEIWAHELSREYLNSPDLPRRLEQRREELFPWVDETTQVIGPDRMLSGDTEFELGGVHFIIRHVGPAHSPEDLAMYVVEDKVLFAGDLVFKGRVPFVGDADSKSWLAALDKLLAFNAKTLVPGHGAVSSNPKADLTLTRDYLLFLRKSMGKAVEELEPFDEAYAKTDWSRWEKLPAFKEANRPNAYNTYLLMEKEALVK